MEVLSNLDDSFPNKDTGIKESKTTPMLTGLTSTINSHALFPLL